MRKILYIHGMGGGADSRIPSILQECISDPIIVRTYDFDPEIAAVQISSWMEEINPALIIAESLGSLHALRFDGIPIIFVSPALNASYYFRFLSWTTFIPGMTTLLDRIYKPRHGNRQTLHFTFGVLRKYRRHRIEAMKTVRNTSNKNQVFAFFGTDDHYRRTGVVSVNTWKKHFGDTYSIYNGTHFMEEEHVRSILADKVSEMLNTNK